MLALLGLGVGGFYGLLACGVVVGHKGSGLINLDQGALAFFVSTFGAFRGFMTSNATVSLKRPTRSSLPWWCSTTVFVG